MKGNYLIIKLLIIIGIVLVGGTVLFPQTNDLFFNDFDETKNDLVDFKDEAINNAEETFDNTIDKITTSIDDTIDQVGSKLSDLNSKEIISAHGMLKKDEPVYYGQVFEKNDQKKTCQVSVPEMAQTINGKKELTYILSIDDCEFQVNDSVRIINRSTGKTSGGSSTSSITKFFNLDSQPKSMLTETIEPKIDLTPSNLIFDTLTLSTVRYQNDENILNVQPNPGDVQIRYEDTSGRTNSVTVTLRNDEKELFSGVFYTSIFTTIVNDIYDSPHILEMVIKHADYGTITSSVFNPAGNFDNTINGVFVKPNLI